MSSPTNHWKLGLFVVVSIGLVFGAAVYLGAASLRRDHVSYHTYFDESVQGLDVGAPILFRGVRVGQVEEIGLAPDRRHIDVTLALFTADLRSLGLDAGDQLAVPLDLRAQIVHQGITGVKVIQLDFFDVRTEPMPELSFEVAGRYIPAARSMLGRLEDSVTGAFERFPAVADALLALAERADKLLAGFERAELPQAAAASFRELDTTLAALRGALDDAAIGDLSAQTRKNLEEMGQVIARFDGVLERVDGERGLLASAQRTTDALGDAAGDAPALTEEAILTLREVQEAAESFRRLTEAIERDPAMLIKGRRE